MAIVCSTAPKSFAPSSQVKVVNPVAFFSKLAVNPVMSRATGRGALWTAAMASAPVDSSAAMLSAAKYVERNGFVDRHP